MDRDAVVVDGARGRGEMRDHVNVAERCVRDIAVEEFEFGLAEEIGDVRTAAGTQVVDDDDRVAVGEQATAEVAPDEASAAGDHDPHRASTVRDRAAGAR